MPLVPWCCPAVCVVVTVGAGSAAHGISMQMQKKDSLLSVACTGTQGQQGPSDLLAAYPTSLRCGAWLKIACQATHAVLTLQAAAKAAQAFATGYVLLPACLLAC